MAEFPERNLNQTCVYWSAPVNDGYGGYTWATPVELDCRWVLKTNVLMSVNGRELVSTVEVRVKQDVDEEGMMWLGNLTDLTLAQQADPIEAGAFQIKSFSKVPTLDATRFSRKAYL